MTVSGLSGSAPGPAPGSAIPRLARGHRLQHDRTRDLWLVQAPEKAFVADPIATEILRRIDGARSIDAIVDDLAAVFAAPRGTIARDVAAMLGDLAAKKVVILADPEARTQP